MRASVREQFGTQTMPDQNHFQINAVAFKEGNAWVIQGIEYDIVTHAYDVTKLQQAFMRAAHSASRTRVNALILRSRLWHGRRCARGEGAHRVRGTDSIRGEFALSTSSHSEYLGATST